VKTLITGGTGFIGSHLAEHLVGKGHTVRCLVRRTSDTRWLRDMPVEYVHGDLFDENALKDAVTGVDYVYHSAGVTKAKTPEEYFRGNTTGTRNLLQAVLQHAPGVKRFVQISSQTAVGPSPTRSPITESADPHPITTYGKSKWKAERECVAMMSRFPITIVRPPAVFGQRDKDVFEFFNTMSKGLQPMVGFNEKYVSLIHVTDLVRGFVMAAESDRSAGQIYFISSKDVYDWKEVGDVTRSILGRRALRLRIPEFGVYVIATFAEFFSLFSSKPALINFEKARDMVQDYWTCDSSKAKRDFGYEQEISLEEGIRLTVGWYKSNGWLK
jgi:nucleoside-diphosphate-sugar epimerase